MINNFWFYFLITPVVVSIIALNSLFVHKRPSTPVFENALEYCQKVDNNYGKKTIIITGSISLVGNFLEDIR